MIKHKGLAAAVLASGLFLSGSTFAQQTTTGGQTGTPQGGSSTTSGQSGSTSSQSGSSNTSGTTSGQSGTTTTTTGTQGQGSSSTTGTSGQSSSPSTSGQSSTGASSGQSGTTSNPSGSTQSSRSTTTTGDAMGALGAEDRKFMMAAAISDMSEIAMAQLALTKAQSEDVKQFAQQMIDEHTKMSEEMKTLATTKGVMLPTEPDAKHQAALAKMQNLSGAAFDRAYVNQAGVKDHEATEKLFQRQIERGTDAEVKAAAQKNLPAVKMHTQMGRDLQAKMSGKSTNTNRGSSSTSGTAGSTNSGSSTTTTTPTSSTTTPATTTPKNQ